MRQIINKLVLNPKDLFLFDGLGALMTSFFLGVILSSFGGLSGMPSEILFFLSITALIYFAYSVCCFFFISDNWRPFLKTICIANVFYCCLTIILVIHFYQQLTVFGIAYFLLETLLICALVFIENRALAISLKIDK
jgi:hypothetical protein